jgi:hypothetical protein
MNDYELREFCIDNYSTPTVPDCDNCPHIEECNDFIERHNGNTPLLAILD